MRSLDRLLRPKSIAVIGGGAWCENVIRECQKIGFAGAIYPVHPKRAEIGGLRCFADLDALPQVPDAAFIGVNRNLTIDMVSQLSAMGAGGAVCFASGFLEASAEMDDGADLQDQLVDAAGDMPILGPNCYGMINALDGAALWPDQHGVLAVDRGVAIITQSSNIAINLTMQARGLPLAYIVTAGNQAQTDLAQIGQAVLADTRVTALGLHIEGISDLRGFEALAKTARDLGKPIVAIKVGASEQAQQATISHTASLAGSDAGARALLSRLGIGQVSSLAALLEALKILHLHGRLPSNRIASLSCSGGEASLMADSALGLNITYPPLNDTQKTDLRAALGPKVALANPLDYHTYIWGDTGAMTACFSAMMAPDLALGIVVLDFPRLDRCDASEWFPVLDAIEAAQDARGVPMAILASLSENMPEAVATQAMARGILPLAGMGDALEAIAICAADLPAESAPLLLPGAAPGDTVLSEAAAKAQLAQHGLDLPQSAVVTSPEAAAEAASAMGFPVVVKGQGIAHKTEAGAVALNLTNADAVRAAAAVMPCESWLVEEMIPDAAVELLIGVTHDPAHGFVLTLGAGGVLTEILRDTVTLLLPATSEDIDQALNRLRCAPLIAGYRGRSGADGAAIIDAVLKFQAYVIDNADHLAEVEVNPLLCTPSRAIVADALIRGGEPENG